LVKRNHTEWDCNRCRKLVSSPEDENPKGWLHLLRVSMKMGKRYDLCPKCKRKFIDFMNGLEVKGESHVSQKDK